MMKQLTLTSEQLAAVNNLLIALKCPTQLQSGDSLKVTEVTPPKAGTPLSALGLSTAVLNALYACRITSVEVLKLVPSSMLGEIQLIGIKSLEEINHALFRLCGAGLQDSYLETPWAELFNNEQISLLRRLKDERFVSVGNNESSIAANGPYYPLIKMGIIVTIGDQIALTQFGDKIAGLVGSFAWNSWLERNSRFVRNSERYPGS